MEERGLGKGGSAGGSGSTDCDQGEFVLWIDMEDKKKIGQMVSARWSSFRSIFFFSLSG